MVNAAPRPPSLRGCRWMLLPCRSKISFVTHNPSPVPTSFLAAKKGSKIRSAAFAAMPGPLSSITNWTVSLRSQQILPSHSKKEADKGILTAGRARAALGCGNPGVMKTRRQAWVDLPYLWVGEPVTYVQAPDAKGHRSRVTPAFQLPDHGSKGCLRGRTANIFSQSLV